MGNLNVMVTTGGTNLRDDIMRLENDSKFVYLYFYQWYEFVVLHWGYFFVCLKHNIC